MNEEDKDLIKAFRKATYPEELVHLILELIDKQEEKIRALTEKAAGRMK